MQLQLIFLCDFLLVYSETYFDRNPGEKIEDRQHRLIATTASFLQSHWSSSTSLRNLSVFVLVNSQSELEQFQKSGCEATLRTPLPMLQYV